MRSDSIEWVRDSKDVRRARQVNSLLPRAVGEAKDARPMLKSTCPSCLGRKSPTASQCADCRRNEYEFRESRKRAAKRADEAGFTWPPPHDSNGSYHKDYMP